MSKLNTDYSQLHKDIMSVLSQQNMDRLRDEMKFIRESRTQQYTEIQGMLSRIQNSTVSINDSLLKDYARLQESFRSTDNSLKWVDDLDSKFRKLLEPMQKFGEVLNSVSKVQRDQEYQKFPFLMALNIDMQTMKSLADQWLSGDKEKVKQRMWEITSSQDFQEDLMNDLSHYSYFQERLDILKDALWAHSNKKFTLSIPVLYLIIDGAFTKEMGMRGKGSKNAKKLKRSPNFNRSLFDLYGAIHFFSSTYSKKRSKILHGLVSDYGKECDLSTILVLSLGSTSYIIDEINVSSSVPKAISD